MMRNDALECHESVNKLENGGTIKGCSKKWTIIGLVTECPHEMTYCSHFNPNVMSLFELGLREFNLKTSPFLINPRRRV